MKIEGWLWSVSVFKKDSSRGLYCESERFFDDDHDAHSYARSESLKDEVASCVLGGVSTYVEYKDGKRV